MLTYRELLETLAGRTRSGAVYTLDRIRALLAALGHPERSFRCWLVAGTNGKGSVAAMLESIAHASGERTGLTVSPHLNRLSERIVVDGREASADDLVWAFDRVETSRAAIGLEATFFECLTAMALLLFARHGVTRAVVEIGLGGRLDANNALPADGSALVSVGLDHTEILGQTLTAIAVEKAQVARPGRPLAIGRLPAEAELAARAAANAIGARVVALGDHLRLEPRPHLEHPAGAVALAPALAGAHQIENAGVAA
ncbi:MAG: bifunctional folylpolyglutamate synthase/dihydrofolate synthase, partial [Deltaproteobacteria bacterium]|nr:bifunctional folylpolyglutamate synthase/dihydrofolate synthase [Deltaproteobacteria bacterium]